MGGVESAGKREGGKREGGEREGEERGMGGEREEGERRRGREERAGRGRRGKGDGERGRRERTNKDTRVLECTYTVYILFTLTCTYKVQYTCDNNAHTCTGTCIHVQNMQMCTCQPTYLCHVGLP